MTEYLQQQLLQWFNDNKREMPWRENPTPYRVWISEVMLQQTTVATVRAFYLRFMECFPSLNSLSKAHEDEILTLWAGLGYYSRARNILKTAQLLKEEQYFPSSFEELKKLPGIGPYTAGAISSIAFNQAVSLIDTNVDRVLGRFFALDRREINFEKILRSNAQKLIELVPKKDIWAWNQAIMELGALICGVRGADCKQCPLQSECQAYALGTPLKFPGDKIKIPITSITEYALILKKENKYLLSKITEGTRRRGLYDFPIKKHALGQEIERTTYRISNNKVERIFCKVNTQEYKISAEELWLSKEEALQSYALVSPCKKFLFREQ